MSYVSQRSQSSLSNLFSTVSSYWHSWRATCDQAIANYHNQRIELNPEGEAQQYWNRLQHPHSGVDTCHITDAMLSRLMAQLLDQGISKFSVDRFILELRRNVRNVR